MVDWIRADDKSRDWPEGPVVAYMGGDLGFVSLSVRYADGSFRGLAKPATHFFYLPPEPSV